MITVFCGLSAVMYLFLFIIWSSKEFPNILFKMAFALLFLYATLCTLWSAGILIKY